MVTFSDLKLSEMFVFHNMENLEGLRTLQTNNYNVEITDYLNSLF